MPFKSTLARSAGKPLGVFKERDLSLRGATQSTRVSVVLGEPIEVANSLRFNSGDSAYLNKTPSSAGDQTTWTWSAWIKRSKLQVTNQSFFGSENGSNREAFLAFNSDDTLRFSDTGTGSNSYILNLSTTQVFRDPFAWYHIVVAWDSNNVTQADRARLYVNGVRVTSFSTNANSISSGADSYVNGANQHFISRYVNYSNSATHSDGYLAEVNFCDGHQLDPTSFAEEDETTGQWVPIEYTGSYGTNGFRLKFANTADLGEDSSGNDNDFTANNLSTTAGGDNDVLSDSPTIYDSGNGVGNYCTWSTLSKNPSWTLSNGNLTGEMTNHNHYPALVGTIAVSSGKWYFEVEYTSSSGSQGWGIGVCNSSMDIEDTNTPWKPGFWGIAGRSGSWSSYALDGTSSAITTITVAQGDILGAKLDLDNNTLDITKNGSALYTVTSSLPADTYFPVAMHGSAPANGELDANFGQRPFDNLPNGYKALNTFNLDDTTILSGTYEGDGDADGPVVWMNGTPATLKIGTSNPPTSLVTFDPAVVDPLASGFKIRHASTNNVDGTTYYWLATIDKAFKYSNAQSNE